MNIMILATAWGPKYGGINSFNVDFAKGLASYLGKKGKVVCGMPYATELDVQVAKESNVDILHLGISNYNKKRLDSGASSALKSLFDRVFPDKEIDYWIGHDVITGEAAISGAELSKSALSVVIAHMNYEAYKSYETGQGDEALKMASLQRNIFNQADHVFANGPYLKQVFDNQLNVIVGLLIPGFADISPKTVTTELRAITIGRLDEENDKIKLPSLAVAGYGSAVRELENSLKVDRKIKWMPKSIQVVGIKKSGDEYEIALRKLVVRWAGKQVTINPVTFHEDTKAIYSELSKANIALMPSWHDGFGLAGWEAIAAEVPLVIGSGSGLWCLIREQFPTEDIASRYVKLIDVQGCSYDDNDANFSEEDVRNVSDAIVGIACNIEQAVVVARDLKQTLMNKLDCTWEKTAELLLEGLRLDAGILRDLTQRKLPPINELDKLSGSWLARYIEGSLGDTPRIIEEEVNLKLSPCRNKLEGDSKTISRKRVIEEDFQNFVLENGILIGESRVKDWVPPEGFSRFQLACTKDGAVLDGIVSWVSGNTGHIDWSRYIMIRPEIQDSEVASFVENEMKSELEEFQNRIRRRRRLPFKHT